MDKNEEFPEFIKVDVQFYDEIEKQKLLKYPSKDEIRRFVPSIMRIPTSEFLTYYLFDRKRSNPIFYSDYPTIGKYIGDALSNMRGLIEFSSESICTNTNVVRPQGSVSQFVGEAIGLSVISKIHQFIKADWIPIEECSKKTLDYEIASNGKEIIQVECKGRSVNNNDTLEQLSAAKTEIWDKKVSQTALDKEKIGYAGNTIKYGTITSLDARINQLVKCRLTDPYPDKICRNPGLLRLIIRLKFLRDWIILISPRSQLASALNTRVGCLEHIKEPFELDNVPLKRTNGEEFYFPSNPISDGESSFFKNKSQIIGDSVGGITLKLSEKELFFLGIKDELPILSANQNFEDIVNFKFITKMEKRNIECNISKRRFEDMKIILPETIEEIKSKTHRKFLLKGQIHYSSSGVVFGILPLE